MCLWCSWEKDLDEQRFNGIYLVRFGIQNVGRYFDF